MDFTMLEVLFYICASGACGFVYGADQEYRKLLPILDEARQLRAALDLQTRLLKDAHDREGGAGK